MTSGLPQVRTNEVLRALRRGGWDVVRATRHHGLEHPTKPGIVLVSTRPTQSIKLGTLRSILQQRGLSANEFRNQL